MPIWHLQLESRRPAIRVACIQRAGYRDALERAAQSARGRHQHRDHARLRAPSRDPVHTQGRRASPQRTGKEVRRQVRGRLRRHSGTDVALTSSGDGASANRIHRREYSAERLATHTPQLSLRSRLSRFEAHSTLSHTGDLHAMHRVRLVRTAATAAVALPAIPLTAARLEAWGESGHKMIGLAAAQALPADMPAFFRQAAAQLSYLNPEPDRWRDRSERDKDPALDGATAPDHFIDLEMIPADRLAGALAAPNRYAYADTLRQLGLAAPTVGLLPWRIVEMAQTLRLEFRFWRAASDDATRRAIEARIINDAGILGHYVADGSNPMHASLQYNGWTGANPNGYATDKRMHGRFEPADVDAQMRIGDITPLIDQI